MYFKCINISKKFNNWDFKLSPKEIDTAYYLACYYYDIKKYDDAFVLLIFCHENLENDRHEFKHACAMVLHVIANATDKLREKFKYYESFRHRCASTVRREYVYGSIIDYSIFF